MSEWGLSDPDGLSGQPLELPQQFDPGGSGPMSSASFSPGSFAPAGGDFFGFSGGGTAAAPSTAGGGSTDWLQQLLASFGGGGGGSGGGGLGGLGGVGSALGNSGQDLMSLINGGSGMNGGGVTGGLEGGLSGALQGGMAGFQVGGPIGGAAGALIEGLLGGLAGSGVTGGLDKFAKPGQYIQNLMGSGNPLEQLLGKYINRSGIKNGYDLSESSNVPFKPGRYADVLQLLSGQGLPKGLDNLGWKNYSQLAQMAPNATQLNFEQLHQIAPEIGALVNRSHGQSLAELLGQESALATKLKNAESY